MKIERMTRVDEVVLSVEGTFDVAAARRLEAALRRAPPHTAVHVDFTRAREFHDFGLAVLAQAVQGAGARVRIRGLRRHQARLLRYLGVDDAVVPEVVQG